VSQAKYILFIITQKREKITFP